MSNAGLSRWATTRVAVVHGHEVQMRRSTSGVSPLSVEREGGLHQAPKPLHAAEVIGGGAHLEAGLGRRAGPGSPPEERPRNEVEQEHSPQTPHPAPVYPWDDRRAWHRGPSSLHPYRA